MTQEIQKAQWQEFFDRISQDFLDWETSVQVMNEATGAQMLSEGLPFNGITLDDQHGHNLVELSLGFGRDNHQTHNVNEAQTVAFEPSGRGPGGTLDIEDESGTKTLVNFLNPMPVLIEYVKSEVLTIG